MLMFSIDPGLSGTGWARWDDSKTPSAVGVIHDRYKDDSLANRCHGIAEALEYLIDRGVSHGDRDIHRSKINVLIEMPQQMSNVRGLAAQGGAIYKLTFLVGYLARAVYPCDVDVINPGQWKGQLPKDVVIRRIQQKLGIRTCERLQIKTHGWDAVGLGLWALGRW